MIIEVASNGWWKCPKCEQLNWVLDKEQKKANCNRCPASDFILDREVEE